MDHLIAEIEDLKVQLRALSVSSYQPDTAPQLEKLSKEFDRKIDALKLENAQLKAKLYQVESVTGNLDAAMHQKAEKAMRVALEATGEVLASERKRAEAELAQTLGSVHTDMKAAKNMAAIHCEMAESLLISKAQALTTQL